MPTATERFILWYYLWDDDRVGFLIDTVGTPREERVRDVSIYKDLVLPQITTIGRNGAVGGGVPSGR